MLGHALNILLGATPKKPHLSADVLQDAPENVDSGCAFLWALSQCPALSLHIFLRPLVTGIEEKKCLGNWDSQGRVS